MPRIRKKTSKRITTHQRTKIQHKVSETRRKKKKESKKNVQWKTKHPKDPGIPSNYPFRDQILAEIQETRRQEEESKKKRKEERMAAKATSVQADPSEATVPASIPSSIISAAKPAAKSAAVPVLYDHTLPDLNAVIEEVDVILQVLDARDPMPFRSQWLEQYVQNMKGKWIAFILNKTDRIPREATLQWLNFLRSSAVTIAFSSSVESSTDNESLQKGSRFGTDSTAVGLDGLKHCLEHWAKKIAATESRPLRVALVGMVNSGKSTILNRLSGSDIVPVYSPSNASAGFSTTRHAFRSKVKINDSQVEVIDTPGLMRQNPVGESHAFNEIRVRDMLHRNRGQVNRINDPLPPIQYILNRAIPEDLMVFYSVPAFADRNLDAFLRALARSKGLVKQGGSLDTIGAAKLVLKDWSLGKFPFYANLPKELPPGNMQNERELLDALTDMFDKEVLDVSLPRKDFWSIRGLIRFREENIDERVINMAGPPAQDTSEPESGDSDGDDSDDEGAIEEMADSAIGDEVEHELLEHTSKGSDIDSASSGDEDEGGVQQTRKRKRTIPPSSKKVSFSVEKKSGKQKSRAPRLRGKLSTKSIRK